MSFPGSDLFFPIVGNFLGLVLFIIPITDVIRVRKSGDNGDMNGLPYLLLMSQCIAWVLYGHLNKNPWLIYVNLIGAILCMFYAISLLANVKNPNDKMKQDIFLLVAVFLPCTIDSLADYLSSESDKSTIVLLNYRILI